MGLNYPITFRSVEDARDSLYLFKTGLAILRNRYGTGTDPQPPYTRDSWGNEEARLQENIADAEDFIRRFDS